MVADVPLNGETKASGGWRAAMHPAQTIVSAMRMIRKTRDIRGTVVTRNIATPIGETPPGALQWSKPLLAADKRETCPPQFVKSTVQPQRNMKKIIIMLALVALLAGCDRNSMDNSSSPGTNNLNSTSQTNLSNTNSAVGNP